MRVQTGVVEIARTVVTAGLVVATLWLSAHAGVTLVALAGVGGLARGATGPWLFAVSGFVGLWVLYAGYVWYYSARQ
ncbi:hypothetical protein [Halobaculum sp. MBLA0143]|uniref:hypothetical protein n=1 Tax=Halobaculum sp. MBLA0143 TaxID=3079933 RepID=UPI0035239253